MNSDRTALVPLLCFSGVPWGYLTMRHQHLMSRLARRHKVLFIEPQTNVLALIRRGNVRAMWQWWQLPRSLDEHLHIYTPPFGLPFDRTFALVNSINQGIVTAAVRLAMKRLNLSAPILWLYEPQHHALIGRFGERLVVYDCVDRHAAFPRWQRPQMVESMERDICTRADLILAASPPLAQALPTSRAQVVPNAADVELFATTASPTTRIPPELAALPRPILGFIGTIDAWVDVELLVRLAREFPHGSVAILGPLRTGRRALRRSNVHLLGPRPHRVLPSYLKGFDVCLLPFRVTALTEASSPVKLYEYVAAGKPVVSTAIPEAARFPDHVLVASGPDEFVSHVGRMLRRDPRDFRPPDMVAESWDARVERVEALLAQALARVSGTRTPAPP